MAHAQGLLKASKESWVSFPDGLSLALDEARKMLTVAEPPEPPNGLGVELAKKGAAPLPPLSLAWTFSVADTAELQRWDLTPDGKAVLLADTQNRIYLLDRLTGRLLWQRRMPKNAAAPPPALGVNSRGDEQILYPPEWVLTNERVCIAREGALFGLSLKDGALLWQTTASATVGDGCLAWQDGRVLWWNAAAVRLDAIDELTGRLAWTCALPELSGPAAVNPQNPQWLAAGIHAASGKVLVWGDGSAVLRVKDGSILWRATARGTAPSFPLELAAEERAALPDETAIVVSANSSTFAATHGRNAGYRPARAIHANVLAIPAYAFPGMYGNAQPTPWIYWGSEQMRLLHGDGIWNTGSNGSERYSILGLPSRSTVAPLTYSGPMISLGFVGKALITASEVSVFKYDPVGAAVILWNSPAGRSDAQEHPMLNATLAGRTLLLAAKDTLRIQDAVSGTLLWEGTWPEDAKPWVKSARESLRTWQSLRWTGRGLFLYNGQGRTITVDWKGLSAHGDWMLPVGTRTLIGLRGTEK
jgi:hypothetical protein